MHFMHCVSSVRHTPVLIRLL